MVALLDRFKRKKAAAGESPPSDRAKAVPPAAAPKAAPHGERRVIGVIISPHLTEKSSRGAAQGWYTFRVRRDANKIALRQAVEDRYGVGVERVRMVRQRSKEVRRGRIIGTSPGFKKAMVKVKAGQSIELT